MEEILARKYFSESRYNVETRESQDYKTPTFASFKNIPSHKKRKGERNTIRYRLQKLHSVTENTLNDLRLH